MTYAFLHKNNQAFKILRDNDIFKLFLIVTNSARTFVLSNDQRFISNQVFTPVRTGIVLVMSLSWLNKVTK